MENRSVYANDALSGEISSTASGTKLQASEKVHVIEVIDGDTLRLVDGREVRLVGIQAPKLPLGRPGFKAWPLSGDAKDHLAGRTLDKAIFLAYGQTHMDRHGRLLAHVYLEDGTWIQGDMLSAGLARVYSFEDNRILIPEMLSLEKTARDQGKGIWNNPFYQIRSADNLDRQIGSFHIVEGRVKTVAKVGKWVYFNFGADWRNDFTLAMTQKTARTFEREGIELEDYEDNEVRSRGWIIDRNGPMILITHPEQVEILTQGMPQ